MASPILYLDLDGVLVDFNRGLLALRGSKLITGEIRVWEYWTQLGITKEEFWKGTDADFWRNLAWTKEGPEFLYLVENIFGQENIVLLTSPGPIPGSVQGKIDWIEKHMPAYKNQYLLGAPKDRAASPAKVLVDDYNENIKKFLAGRGKAVMVPRPWNDRRTDADWTGGFDVVSIANEVAQQRAAALHSMNTLGCY